MPSYLEEDILAAIASYKRREYKSISYTSQIFGVPSSTLHNRIFKPNSKIRGYTKQQILSPIEEETLEN